MASANLFQQFLQPVRSVQDYANDLDLADARRAELQTRQQQNALSSLSLAQARRQADDAEGDRNALQRISSTWNADTTADQRVAGLRNSGRAGLMTQADALEKAAIERQKGAATAAKDTAEADKIKLATDYMRRDRHLQGLASVTTPEQAAAWIGQGVQLGEFSMQDAQRVLQGIQSGQIPLEAWKQRAQQGGMSLQQQAQQRMQELEYGLKAQNELIGPDGKVNQPLLNAKREVARAGASNVSVNTGQKGLDNEFKLRGEFKQEPVYKAHQEMQSAYAQIQQSLKQGTPAGDLAGATKLMKLLDPGSVVRESELGMAMAATGLLDRATNYASNVINGTKLTPKQRVEFQALADALMGESSKQFDAKRGEYERLGSEYGLNAGRALGPNATPVPAASKPAAAGAGGGQVIRFDAQGNQIKGR